MTPFTAGLRPAPRAAARERPDRGSGHLAEARAAAGAARALRAGAGAQQQSLGARRGGMGQP